MIYKFVRHDISPLELYVDTFQYKLHGKLECGDKLTREEKDWLVFTTSEPVYKRMGWAYNYLEFLTTYYVKCQYGIMEVYAWDRTGIRKSDKIGGWGKIINITPKEGEDENEDE